MPSARLADSVHIVFLSARYPPDTVGGGEISTRILARAIANAGHEVTVLCGSLADQREEPNTGVRVVRSRALFPWWGKPLNEERVSRNVARAVTELLSQLPVRPEVIHAHDFRSALSLAFLDHPRRFVTVRDYAPICGTTSNMWWDGTPCNGCFWPNVLFRCHRVAEASPLRKPFRVRQYKGNLGFRKRAYHRIPSHIYTSSILRDRVLQRLQLSSSVQTTVIPNPIDYTWLSTPLAPLPSRPILCAPGRLETTKGTEVLLHAFRLVLKEIPSAELHLVGGGEITRYKALARTLGLERSVIFHGQVAYDRVRELIDISAIVVSAHLWEEPFGRVALEAGARGRALVASDLGGIRELVTPEAAVLVPPKNPESLAEVISTIVQNPERLRAMGAQGRQHIEHTYHPSEIATVHLALYRSAC